MSPMKVTLCGEGTNKKSQSAASVASGNVGGGPDTGAKEKTEAVTQKDGLNEPIGNDVGQTESAAKTSESNESNGDPVDMATGAFLYEDNDFILPEMHSDFKLIRRYASIKENKERESIGPKWTLSVDAAITRNGEYVVVSLPDGKGAEFTFQNGYYNNRRGTHKQYVLRRPKDDFYFEDNEKNLLYTFDETGKLKIIADRQGNETKFSYGAYGIERVDLSTGLYLIFSWKDMKVCRVEDNMGRTVEYHYQKGILSEVTRCDGTTISYTYDQDNNLLTVTDGNRCTYLTNEYDEKSRVKRQCLTDGTRALFIYDDQNRTNTFYDETNDITTKYTYDDKKDIIKVAYEDGTSKDTVLENGLIVKEINRNGVATEYRHDIYGHVVSKEEPTGLITSYSYEGKNLVKVSDNAGRWEVYTYDAKGNVVTHRIRTGGERDEDYRYIEYQYAHDDKGRVLTFSKNGQLLENYIYRTGHNSPTEIRKSNGAVIRMKYDAVYRLVERDTNGAVEKYEYMPYNKLRSYTDGEGAVTRYYYDNSWRLVKKVEGENNVTGTDKDAGESYTYDDMDRMTGVTDATGVATVYVLNTNGDVVEEQRGGRVAVRYDYDKDFNPIRKHIITESGTFTEKYEYDACGELIKKVPAGCYDKQVDDGAGYRYERDRGGRITRVYDPEGCLTDAYSYDKRGNVLVHRHSFSRDNQALNDYLLATEHAGDLYTYDNRGKMTEKRVLVSMDESGEPVYAVTQYVYDTEENLVKEYVYKNGFGAEEKPEGEALIITREYDASGRLVSISDNSGASIERTYDSNDCLVREVKAVDEIRKEITEYEYDGCQRVLARRVKKTKASGADAYGIGQNPNASSGDKPVRRNRFVSVSEVEVRNRQPKMEEVTVSETVAAYDASGRLVKIIRPEGRIEEVGCDAAGRRISLRATDINTKKAFVVTYAYDELGYLAEENNNGIITRYANDIQGNCIAETAPDGGVRRFEYDEGGRLTKMVSPMEEAFGGNRGTTYFYDNQGRLVKEVSASGAVMEELSYDLYGRVTGKTLADGESIRYVFDLGGRCILAETKEGIREEYAYDAAGNLKANATGKAVTAYECDSWGRITEIKAPEGVVEKYTYNHMGNIVETVDGEGNTTRYEVNSFGKLDRMVHGDGMAESFVYDREGRIQTHTKRSGKQISYSYDAFGNLTGKKGDADANAYTYDEAGRLATAGNAGITYSYSYDNCGRLESKKACGRNLISYTYDLNGNVAGVTDVKGKTTHYMYDIENRLQTITESGRTLATYTYTAGGKLASVTCGNIVTTYTYDKAGNTAGITTKAGEELLNSITYRYDDRGNCIGKEVGGYKAYGVTYGYDSLDRLISESRKHTAGMQEYRYTYDKSGNRTSLEKTGDGQSERTEYVYNALNQLKELKSLNAGTAKSAIFDYDKDGNLTSDGKGIYVYDDFDHMINATMSNGDVFACRYDAEGLRYEAEENARLFSYIYRGRDVVVEESTEETVRYIRGNGRLVVSDSDKARSYYHYASDQLGSIQYVVDGGNANGSLDERLICSYEYDAFGNLLEGEEKIRNPFRFTGEQYDAATGLYYLRARYYNPVIGRFTQQDTYLGDGLNLYAYVQNNPVKYVDPSGHAAECTKGNGIGNSSYDPSTNKYPPRTPYAQRKCQNVVDVANSLKYTNHPVVSIFTHEDGTVSVGFSGQSGTKGSKKYATDLQKALDERYGEGKYTVSAGIDSDLEKTMRESGKPVLGNDIGNCAEPKAASAAAKNTSPITGMDTRWRHGEESNPHPYTGKDKTSGSQMNPCKTCDTFEDEYMKHANKGKRR